MQVLKIAGLPILMSLVWAAIWALFYKFPFPLEGLRGGVGAALMAPISIAVYGILFAGFLVPIVLALIVYGLMTAWEMWTPRARLWIGANVGGFLFAGGLATLHLFIGNW
jgi:hypothetical protein